MKKYLRKTWQVISWPFRKIPSNSWQALLLHIGIMVAITALAILYFFKVYLPSTTDHGQEQKVPDLEGLTIKEARKVINQEGLRDSIVDTVWSPRHEPLTIISHNPDKGSKVKKNRMVYLTINSTAPPKVEITNRIYKRICRIGNAQAVNELHEIGLKAKAQYTRKKNKGFVYDVFYKGKPVQVGDKFKIGTVLTLVIGRGDSDRKKELFYDTVKYDE